MAQRPHSTNATLCALAKMAGHCARLCIKPVSFVALAASGVVFMISAIAAVVWCLENVPYSGAAFAFSIVLATAAASGVPLRHSIALAAFGSVGSSVLFHAIHGAMMPRGPLNLVLIPSGIVVSGVGHCCLWPLALWFLRLRSECAAEIEAASRR